MALITRSPDFSLEQAPQVSNAFEIHNLADGSGMLGDSWRHTSSFSRRRVSVRRISGGLYSNLSIKAPHIIVVPLAKLVVDRMPIRLDPKEPDSAVLIDIDLQGTAHVSSITGWRFSHTARQRGH